MERTGKSLALAWTVVSPSIVQSYTVLGNTYGKGVDHGLEAQIDLSGADDLSHILY